MFSLGRQLEPPEESRRCDYSCWSPSPNAGPLQEQAQPPVPSFGVRHLSALFLFFRQGFLYSRLTSNSRPSSCLSLECWSNNREAPGSGSYSLRANKTRTFYLWRVCRGVCAEDSFWEALLFLLEVLGDQIKAFGFGGN